MIVIVPPERQRSMPWKNGLGRTTELAVSPPGAALDDFTWRLSIAELTVSGPFSTFPGYDRVLLQLGGEPMTLHHEGHGTHRLAARAPHRFAGEWQTRADVPSPARDFNVMTRRGRAQATVEAWTTARRARLEAATTQALYVVEGEALVETMGGTSDVGPGFLVLVDGAATLTTSAGAVVIVVGLVVEIID